MQPYPHHYAVSAAARSTGNVRLTAPDVVPIESAPPREYDGPGGQWSPESLLVAAVADCFVLSFRAIARASKLDWLELSCDAVGILDQADGVTRFTRFDVEAGLTVPAGTDEAKATRLMQKAEQVCLITNSLIADSHLKTTVSIAGD